MKTTGLVIALVLGWTAQASAECAWVFWSHPANSNATPTHFWVDRNAWVPTSAAKSLEECREIQGKFSKEETKCLPNGMTPITVRNPK